ncbi:unnamed protein product [Ranitomeya imitator]|uniref:UBC core domain-containing protein n=1 Tax=Ranitomeya imitator TaxID=111125 RepID=A0ABN9LS12_9NEOB|nr:unnamed protein product [Ranitomeya imitator]
MVWVRYQDEILGHLVRPYAGAVGPGFLLMQDKARPHVAGVSQPFLQDVGIEAMNWLTRSPDLTPTEHIWDIMSRTIHQRHIAPQTVQELADALVQIPSHPPNQKERSQRAVRGGHQRPQEGRSGSKVTMARPTLPVPSSQKALLLELKGLQEEPVEGFRVTLVDEADLYNWEVAIFGPPNTFYEGGYFKARLKFPIDYPYSLPQHFGF